MTRRITLSQFRSQLRQAESKQRQALQRAQHQDRQAELKMKRAVQQYNQKRKRAIDHYNRDVRAYNRQIEANRSRIRQALQKLSQVTVTARYTVLHASARALNEAYVRLQQQPRTAGLPDDYDALLAYAEHENANSLDLASVLLGGTAERPAAEEDLCATAITSELSRIQPDLDSRWHGAVYSLSPRNPDAARHFCTSAREIITTILHVKAPDTAVVGQLPGCDTDQNGRPTRRSRIHYCLQRKGLATGALEEFVEEDIRNVLELFNVLSAGTHGPAGKYGLAELMPIKQRVEDAILFLARIVG